MPTKFNRRLKKYLTVYKIPIGPNQLDPTVFYFDSLEHIPKLLPNILSQITRDVESIAGNCAQLIKECYLVGPSLNPGNNNTSGALKVLLVLNKSMLDSDGLLAENVLKSTKYLSGRLALQTIRPINYIPMIRTVDTSDYKAIYDLTANAWKKMPNGLA